MAGDQQRQRRPLTEELCDPGPQLCRELLQPLGDHLLHLVRG